MVQTVRLRPSLLPLCFSILFLFPNTTYADQKKPSPGVKVNPDTVFQLTDSRGQTFQCAVVKGRLRSGSLKKGDMFLPLSETLLTLKKKVRSCKGKLSGKKKSLCAKYKRTKELVAERDALCKEGPDPLSQLRRPLTESDIRYLYEKTAFGAVTPEAIAFGLQNGVSVLVDELMRPKGDANLEVEAAKFLDGNFASDPTPGAVTEQGLRLWALHLMLNTPDPFNERLAFLFLHNLLATSMEVLTEDGQDPLMREHMNKIRAGAISGDYRALLLEIARDPVMLIWLSGNQNTKQQPNENFARELMELFTLGTTDRKGQSNYSEQTVAQVARACTGWTVQRSTLVCGQPGVWCTVFGQAIHDPDPNKIIFEGRAYQGVVTNDLDVMNHIFNNHPNTSIYLAERLLKEYLNENPSEAAILSAAKLLKASNYNFRPVLAKLLKSEEFYKLANRNSIVKGPWEKMVTFLRATGIPFNRANMATALLASSDGGRPTGLDNTGQLIGMPPSVFGWDNPDWPNGAWLLSFSNTLTVLLRNDGYFNSVGFNYQQLLPHTAATAAEVLAHWKAKLNVTLSPEQDAQILHYMNNRAGPSNTLVPESWDPANAARVRRKTAGLLEILARSNDFQMR